MNKLKSLFLSFFFCFPVLLVYAQNGITRKEEPTDFMRSNGKIFVVVAVIVIILSGLFLYLYNLDKKVSALEKTSHNNKGNVL